MSSSDNHALVDRALSEAETKGIDLDGARVVDSDMDGTTIRVLAVDAPEEKDQVGFQVTRPPGEMGDTIFQRSLSDGLRELKRYLREKEGDEENESDDEGATVAETPDEDPRTDQTYDDELNDNPPSDLPAQALSIASIPGGSPTETLSLEVQVDPDSLQNFRDDFEDLFDEYRERVASTERADELEERLENVDERLTRLEQSLTMLGKINQ